MKRYILLLFTLLPLAVSAQEIDFDSMMKEYSSRSKCTTLNISNAMIRSMGVDIDAESVRVIAIEDASLIPDVKKQINTLVKGLEVVMQMNSEGESVDIYQRANSKGEVSDILIVTISDDECVLLYVYGNNIQVEKVNSLINL